jgi:hypothetical protein
VIPYPDPDYGDPGRMHAMDFKLKNDGTLNRCISGYHMLRVLAEAPSRWTKIYCLSRRPPAIPGGLPVNAEHIALDFLKEPQEIAKVLKEHGIKAYVCLLVIFRCPLSLRLFLSHFHDLGIMSSSIRMSRSHPNRVVGFGPTLRRCVV